jgi:hypothetical protein
MKKTLAAGIAALALLGLPTPAEAYDPVHRDWVFPRGLPYAPQEDSCHAYRCVWDARHQGNGLGTSLIITRFGNEWTYKFITHRRAHRLHHFYCERPRVNCD